jgi:ribosomal protein S18 acetylase RimI-like enzyme
MVARLSIRRATRRDAARIVPMLVAQLRGLDTATPRSDLASAADGMLARASRGFILLASLGDFPVGVAYVSFIWTLEHGGHSAWLEELYVIPEYRGRGIGRRLLTAAIGHARALGCRAIDLEVDRKHPRASSLYDREGFVRLGRSRWALKLKPRRRASFTVPRASAGPKRSAPSGSRPKALA